MQWTVGARRKASRRTRFRVCSGFSREVCRAHCSLGAASCVDTGRGGPVKRRSEPWLRAPLSQPSSSLEKKGSTVVQGRSEPQEGNTWQFRGQWRRDNPSGQSRRPPPSGQFGYYMANAVERLALRHLGANELSGRLANFFFPLAALAVNQSSAQLLLEVASIILWKPRIPGLAPSPSLTPFSSPLRLTKTVHFCIPLAR